MAKLMRVTSGTALLVAVDIRPGSPTLAKHVALEASAANRVQLFAPAGFARGFCVLTESAEVQYKCTALYNPAGESGIHWDDPRIGIAWPTRNPIVSLKDASAASLDEWLARPEAATFRYTVAPTERSG
jgi:dTDP-4-dehydrorhamnose 3,5-epimerase